MGLVPEISGRDRSASFVSQPLCQDYYGDYVCLVTAYRYAGAAMRGRRGSYTSNQTTAMCRSYFLSIGTIYRVFSTPYPEILPGVGEYKTFGE